MDTYIITKPMPTRRNARLVGMTIGAKLKRSFEFEVVPGQKAREWALTFKATDEELKALTGLLLRPYTTEKV